MKSFFISLLSVCSFTASFSQSKNYPPKVLDKSFDSLKISPVGMLPTADYRQDRGKPFKQKEYLRKWLCPNLKKKGYSCEFTGDTALSASRLSLDGVLNYNDSLSIYLGESKYRFVFLPLIVAGKSNNYGIGKSSSASIVGIIFDKQQKKIIWMSEAEGKNTDFGAIAVFSDVLAIDEAMYFLMKGLPKRKK